MGLKSAHVLIIEQHHEMFLKEFTPLPMFEALVMILIIIKK